MTIGQEGEGDVIRYLTLLYQNHRRISRLLKSKRGTLKNETRQSLKRLVDFV